MIEVQHCWSCAGTTDDLFCQTCGALQPPVPRDLFARLGLEPAFDVDLAALERRYFDLQRKLHPDRFAARPAVERTYSLQHAANLNEAFQTLRSVLPRAEYLLALRGHPVRREEETIADPEILMHAMEMREALAEAETSAEVEAVATRAREEASEVVRDLAAAFANGDLDDAAHLALRLRYLDKFSDEAREKRGRAA